MKNKTRFSPALTIGAVISLLPMLFAAPMPPVRAELPPGSYQILQKGAPEFVHIKVIGVQVRGVEPGTDVRLTARVTSVVRSQSHLRKGDIIRIAYTSFNHWPAHYAPHGVMMNGHRYIPHIVGPAIVPVLETGKSYPAFLRLATPNPHRTYEPAAYGHSFEVM